MRGQQTPDWSLVIDWEGGLRKLCQPGKVNKEMELTGGRKGPEKKRKVRKEKVGYN